MSGSVDDTGTVPLNFWCPLLCVGKPVWSRPSTPIKSLHLEQSVPHDPRRRSVSGHLLGVERRFHTDPGDIPVLTVRGPHFGPDPYLPTVGYTYSCGVPEPHADCVTGTVRRSRQVLGVVSQGLEGGLGRVLDLGQGCGTEEGCTPGGRYRSLTDRMLRMSLPRPPESNFRHPHIPRGRTLLPE